MNQSGNQLGYFVSKVKVISLSYYDKGKNYDTNVSRPFKANILLYIFSRTINEEFILHTE